MRGRISSTAGAAIAGLLLAISGAGGQAAADDAALTGRISVTFDGRYGEEPYAPEADLSVQAYRYDYITKSWADPVPGVVEGDTAVIEGLPTGSRFGYAIEVVDSAGVYTPQFYNGGLRRDEANHLTVWPDRTQVARWPLLRDDRIVNRQPNHPFGRSEVGRYSYANTGQWSPARVSLQYAWFLDGVLVEGQGSEGFEPTQAMKGAALTARVTASAADLDPVVVDLDFGVIQAHQPFAPQAVKKEGQSTSSLLVGWKSHSAVGSHDVTLRLGSTVVGTRTVVGAARTALITGLRPGLRYTATVVARSVEGLESGPTSLDMSTPPARPARPTASKITRSSVVLSWPAAAGAHRYDLQCRKHGSSSKRALSTTSRKVKITKLSRRSTYSCIVKAAAAYDGSAVSDWSSVRKVTTKK